MKELLFSIVADPHLSDKNYLEVEAALKKSIDKTVEGGASQMHLIGDIFTDRKSQSFNTLQTFGRVLDYAHEKGVSIEGFPGNHDKIDYYSERSYLDVFRHYPAFELVTTIGRMELDSGWTVFQLPFFKEVDALLPYLDQLKEMEVPEKSILFTHIAIDGVMNNDGSEIKGILAREVFERFEKVIVGHYHEKQEFNNIYYIGSLLQNNFGENELKGITYFYSDGEMVQEPIGERRYLTIDVDLEKVGKGDVDSLMELYEGQEDRVRFKFEGTKAQFKVVNRSLVESKGIKVAFKENQIEEVLVDGAVADNFAAFNRTTILEEWNEYCGKDRDRKGIKAKGKLLLEETL